MTRNETGGGDGFTFEGCAMAGWEHNRKRQLQSSRRDATVRTSQLALDTQSDKDCT